MRSRPVFPKPRLVRRVAPSWLGVALGMSFGACSGPRFSHGVTGNAGASAQSGGGTSGAAAGGGGRIALAGMAGGAGASGRRGFAGGGGLGAGGSNAGGEAGIAGSAGAGDVCQCGVSQYCRAGTCLDCSDLSQLDFADATELLSYPGAGSGLRFPREGSAPGSLFYTLVTPSVSELWYTSDVAASPGMAIGASTDARFGLDFFGDPGTLGFDVLFGEAASDGRRSIRAATWQASMLGSVVDAPPPLQPFDQGSDDYSIAFARATERTYFMTTRSGSVELVTGTLGSAQADAVVLALPAAGGGTCPRTGDDATPWVTPDGRLLLFSAPPVDPSCQLVDGSATDLYVALLNSMTGLPLATAVPLVGVNLSSGDSSESDASFSADLCTLYFASDGGTAQGHDFRLYSAARR
jgi:hypothetical protein